ncbi:hypothetical protein Msil_1795 [Methylocella silvestris BL2]|uniref:Uncharacterized protein n=1 Tax=Methylocella silvestris (strain DSM 15510 / CIP 108128 / LMG 27833 / NCIMB 13906 / BL2) TaxID=395965 RepID=B8ELV9_METSB|nr:hypothetical protein [Methylocella silvestris]ACK50740.1 hypothetical protein Msil_1795 [Methylocella silvestris BL2]
MHQRHNAFFLAGALAVATIGAAGPARCSGYSDPLFDALAWPPFRPAVRQQKAAKTVEFNAARFQDRPRMSCASIACPGIIILGVGF